MLIDTNIGNTKYIYKFILIKEIQHFTNVSQYETVPCTFTCDKKNGIVILINRPVSCNFHLIKMEIENIKYLFGDGVEWSHANG